MKPSELRLYQNFLLLAQELHFGRAAELASITQPALSQQIARLEESLGVKLLVRDQRQLALTPAGVVFRDGIAKIISNFDQLAQQTAAAAGGENTSISIGITEYANLPVLADAMSQLLLAYPGARLERHEILHQQHGGALMRGQIDVGIGVVLGGSQAAMAHSAEISSRLVAASDWSLLLPDTHRWAGAQQLPLASLAEERIVTFAREVNPPVYDGLVAACQAAGVTPNFVFGATQSLFGIQLARDGMGLMLGTAFVLGTPPPGMRVVPLTGLEPLTMVANWRSDECRPVVKNFVELLFASAGR
ncbi:LysR family transcriptional regulator [Pseudoduganella sp. FT26W]|uniref:LysR family transcriptional regulator n=1 Tax=Duganella aquatilis TaxID=2666082 RepID=A0A844DF10_9BURK|nr:LysR family transcriptional regulator [Duganella aquatilis]